MLSKQVLSVFHIIKCKLEIELTPLYMVPSRTSFLVESLGTRGEGAYSTAILY